MKKGSSYKKHAKVGAMESAAPEFESEFRRRLGENGAPSFMTVLAKSSFYLMKIMNEFDHGKGDDNDDLIGQFVEENTFIGLISAFVMSGLIGPAMANYDFEDAVRWPQHAPLMRSLFNMFGGCTVVFTGVSCIYTGLIIAIALQFESNKEMKAWSRKMGNCAHIGYILFLASCPCLSMTVAIYWVAYIKNMIALVVMFVMTLGFSATLIVYGIAMGCWSFLSVQVELGARVELTAPLREIKAKVGAYLDEVDPALATMKELEGRLVQTLSSRPPDDNTETKDYNGYVLSASVKRVAKTILDKMIEARIDDELKAGDDLVVQAFDS